MGRNRKPLSAQNGNLTQKFQKQREFEENLVTGSKSELAKPPTWLINATAKKEWNRIVDELGNIGMICNLDIDNIGGFCNAFAMYLKVTKELKKVKLTVIGGNGQETEHPLIGTQRKYAQEMRDFAKLCGLTIDSRLKFAAQKAKDIDNEIDSEFGDI